MSLPTDQSILTDQLTGTTNVIDQTPSPMPTTSSKMTFITAPGLSSISLNSNGNFMIGSLTLTPGMTVTQGRGSSTHVVALQTSGGSTALVVADATTTQTQPLQAVTVIPMPTSTTSATLATAAADDSIFTINGQTYSIAGATLNANAASAALPASSTTASGAAAAGTALSAKLQTGSAGSLRPWTGAAFGLLVGAAVVAM